MSSDRRGLDYADLLAIQEKHLEMWRQRLRPGIYDGVAAYVRKQNTSAIDSNQLHRVFRGQDLTQIIMEWPELSSYYPPVKEASPSDLI